MDTKEAAIIVAGGKGLRLPADVPKQFIEVGGLPVLMHTINAFRAYNPSLEILLVIPAGDFARWESLCHQYHFVHGVRLVAGGSTRFQSVKNGLDQLSSQGFVAVHDGVRPLVTPKIIAASFEMARKHRSAVASVPLKESIRELRDASTTTNVSTREFSSHTSFAIDRTKFRLMQTPQTFDVALLKSSYEAAVGDAYTDDASVVEGAGHAITLFEGSYENLKITTPEDLIVAEAILRSRVS